MAWPKIHESSLDFQYFGVEKKGDLEKAWEAFYAFPLIIKKGRKGWTKDCWTGTWTGTIIDWYGAVPYRVLYQALWNSEKTFSFPMATLSDSNRI